MTTTQANKTLVYVGGHVGVGARQAIDRVKPDRVIIFEPHPDCVKTLKAKFPEARVVQAACAEKTGFGVLRNYGLDSRSASLFEITPEAVEVLKGFGVTDLGKQYGGIPTVLVNLGEWLKTEGLTEGLYVVLDCQGGDLAVAKTLKGLGVVEITAEVDGPIPHYKAVNGIDAWTKEMLGWGFTQVWRRHDWTDPSEIQNDIRWVRA